MRIVEAAAIARPALAWLPAEDDMPATWLLEVIARGMKLFFAPVTVECFNAYAHWRNRGQDVDVADALGPVAPLTVPSIPQAGAKSGAGFAVGSVQALDPGAFEPPG